jgi:hypothetical protein
LKRLFITVAAAIAMSLIFGTTAIAHDVRLGLFTDGSGAEIGWVRGPDSPLDTSSREVALNIRTDPGEYAYAYKPGFGLGAPGGTSVAGTNVRNVSFDFLNTLGGGYVGAGAPGFSVAIIEASGEDADSDDFAFLSAFYCQLPTGDASWSRADFTGATDSHGECALQFEGVTYSNSATQSAWQVFVAANPGVRVDYAFVIVDETTQPTRVRLDRIAMQNHMQLSGGRTVHCPNEGSC